MNIRKISAPAAIETALILAVLWGCTAFIDSFLSNSSLVLPAAGILSLLLLLALCFPDSSKKAADFCFRYRWWLALLIFLACLVLRLHGSSIGVYDEILPTQITGENSRLFGKLRWVRSDEYGVTTLKFFSQAANDYRLYSRQISLSPTNMVLDYYSPVWDWTILGKPLAWGFLLFGNEVGLSWYWCGEIILLFMTALEMCLILTNGTRSAALTGAFLIAFSPAIQWWVMPHMPPVILYSMALFCIGYRLFTAKNALSRGIASGLSLIAVLGFALSLFPSFQVPCGYTVLVLLAMCLWRDREKIRFTRRDWMYIALPAAAALAILLRFVLLSREDLSLLLNTVYPGRRMSRGGDRRVADLFTDLITFFLPYQDVPFLNNCEVATYIHAAPLFLVLSPYLLPALKKRQDRSYITGAALYGVLLVQCVFMLMGFPMWLSEITLLHFCNRMNQVYGWVAVLFTVWGMDVLLRHPDLLSRRAKLLLPPVYGAVSLLTLNQQRLDYLSNFVFHGISLGSVLIVLLLAAVLCTLYFAVFQREKLLSAALILAVLFGGATVNPVMRGIGPVTNHPISKAVAELAEAEPESRWICTDVGTFFMLSNYVSANGAVCLTATNFYPDPEKWAILDPDGKYEELTNRYANECAQLTEGETAVEMVYPDQIKLLLNPESLKKLDIRYLFSSVDYTEMLSKYGIGCTRVTGQDKYSIYRLEYPE